MKLADWITEERLTFDQAAALFGVSGGSVVYRYAKGGRMPRPAVMQRIFEATGGEVTANDFHHGAGTYHETAPAQSASERDDDQPGEAAE